MQAKADAAEAARQRDTLELHHREEMKRLTESSISDLEFEREKFNLSIT
jgi:hypothetical protein